MVNANYTLSFQSPKLVFFLPGTAKYTIQWEVLDIGIDRDYLMETETEVELIYKHEVLPLYKPRNRFAHKGDFGHGLIIGGNYGKMGAVVMAAKALLRSGAGLCSVFIPKCGYTVIQTAIPEAMAMTDNNEILIENISFNMQPTAIGIGVGMGTDAKTVKAFETFLKKNKSPLVIDADGLNMLSSNSRLFRYLPENTILTPHPKELERLVGSWTDDFDKLKKTEALSSKHKIIIVIKGANTMTIYGHKKYINVTGNPGMATGGAGDVLTGMITGLLCQDYNPLEAALFGVYLHGKAGDLVLEDFGYQSLMATDVIEGIGEAYIDLFKQPENNKELQEEDES